MVTQQRGDWLGVWYLDEIAWIHSPQSDPVVRPSQGRVVVATGGEQVPVYGRAYPEASAYPSDIPVQKLAPLQYSIKPGQAYVLADDELTTDYYYYYYYYYYAKTFDDSLAGDHTVVVGEDEYYQIWFGHRIAYVRAADVLVKNGVATLL